MKRDYTQEIIKIRQRNGQLDGGELQRRLEELEEQFQVIIRSRDAKMNKAELIKYFPIATVACAEAFFRTTCQQLIDLGEPFSKNAVRFNQVQNVKFDFELVNAIQGKAVTIGEIVSHILPFNNLKDINSNLSIITGKDFLKELKLFKRESKVVTEHTKAVNFFSENHDAVLTSVERIYELRHIYCHEFGLKVEVDLSEVRIAFAHMVIFLLATEWYLMIVRSPNPPETMSDIVEGFTNSYNKSHQDLYDSISRIRASVSKAQLLHFETLVKAWEEYCDKSTEFYAAPYTSGSLERIVRLVEMDIRTEEFAKQLSAIEDDIKSGTFTDSPDDSYESPESD